MEPKGRGLEEAKKESNSWWSLFAKVSAVVTTIGGLGLHLMGYMTHQKYLTTWGLDPGIFPLATDTTIINGLMTLVYQAATLISALEDTWELMVVVALILWLYIFVILQIARANERKKVSYKKRHIPARVIDVIASFLTAISIVTFTPFLVLIVVVALAIPALAGENYGRVLAKQEMEKYSTGCKQKDEKVKCLELRKAGMPIARGFLLESNQTHIAIYYVDKKYARTLERDGTEIVGVKGEVSYDSTSKTN